MYMFMRSAITGLKFCFVIRFRCYWENTTEGGTDWGRDGRTNGGTDEWMYWWMNVLSISFYRALASSFYCGKVWLSGSRALTRHTHEELGSFGLDWNSIVDLLEEIKNNYERFTCQILFLSFSELISTLANLSFSDGIFPFRFKIALVSLLIKKHGLDKEVPSNYRPISNLNNISKILERLLLARVQDHIISSTNFNLFQSAYRKYNSTEIALHSTICST